MLIIKCCTNIICLNLPFLITVWMYEPQVILNYTVLLSVSLVTLIKMMPGLSQRMVFAHSSLCDKEICETWSSFTNKYLTEFTGKKQSFHFINNWMVKQIDWTHIKWCRFFYLICVIFDKLCFSKLCLFYQTCHIVIERLWYYFSHCILCRIWTKMLLLTDIAKL